MNIGRDSIVQYLKEQLLGPRIGPDELLLNPPLDNYITGILYPPQKSLAESTSLNILHKKK